jgi:hypothetical protein
MPSRWTSIFTAVAVLATVGITAPPASAQWGRAINVNGQWLNPYQIAEVDQIAGFRCRTATTGGTRGPVFGAWWAIRCPWAVRRAVAIVWAGEAAHMSGTGQAPRWSHPAIAKAAAASISRRT